MRQRKREFTATPETLRKLNEVHDSAIEVAKRYLDRPVKEMQTDGCNGLVVACAFISLGYHLLRQERSEKDAVNAFNALAAIGMRRNEAGRKREAAARRHRLH